MSFEHTIYTFGPNTVTVTQHNELHGFFTYIVPLVIMLLFVAATVMVLISLWKIFEKAGREGWKALVPIYNLSILYDILKMPAYLALFMVGALWAPVSHAANSGNNLVIGNELATTSNYSALGSVCSLALMVLYVVTSFKLAKAFGKGIGFGFGILFLPFIFLPILAFGDAKFIKEKKK